MEGCYQNEKWKSIIVEIRKQMRFKEFFWHNIYLFLFCHVHSFMSYKYSLSLIIHFFYNTYERRTRVLIRVKYKIF